MLYPMKYWIMNKNAPTEKSQQKKFGEKNPMANIKGARIRKNNEPRLRRMIVSDTSSLPH